MSSVHDTDRALDARPGDSWGRTIARLALGGFLVFAGIGHLSFGREAFQAQVPSWVPLDADAVVLASGVVEVALGTALVAVRGHRRALVGGVVAAFFVAVFPGNISQLVTRTDAFGLDSDAARATRLVFQPLLVGWALWSTGAWETWRRHRGTSVRSE
ncbi:MAG: hypothetical protein ACOH17_13475 [Cellulomonas sp.]